MAAAAPGITYRHNRQRQKENLLFMPFSEAKKHFKEVRPTLAMSIPQPIPGKEKRKTMTDLTGQTGHRESTTVTRVG